MVYKILDGNEATCEALKLSRVEVIGIFPITPMTDIANKLAEMVDRGELKAELIQPENEDGSLSVCLGAASAGARTFTSSSSQGIVYMEEVIWLCPGWRVPIVMAIANRSISNPGSLQSTHSDSLLQRDSGWVQLYCENAQEVLDTCIMAYKIAEDKRVLLPTIYTMDGYTVSACAMPVNIPDQKEVDEFLPPYKPDYFLNPDNPPKEIAPRGVETELRYQLEQAQENAKEVIKNVNNEFMKYFGRRYGNGLIEKYRCEDARGILITMGSITGTARDAIDEMRAEDKPIGLVKLKSFRPFPTEDIQEIGRNVDAIGFVDKNFSHGSAAGGGIGTIETARALYSLKEKPHLLGFIAGIGGRDVTIQEFKYMANKVLKACETGVIEKPVEWIQLKK